MWGDMPDPRAGAHHVRLLHRHRRVRGHGPPARHRPRPRRSRSRSPARSSPPTRSAWSSAPRSSPRRPRGLPRKRVLLMMVGIFIIGNFVSAIAPNYLLLIAARVLAAFAHGTLFGVGAVVAAGMVPADRQAPRHRPDVPRPHARQHPRRAARHLRRPELRLARDLRPHHRARPGGARPGLPPGAGRRDQGLRRACAASSSVLRAVRRAARDRRPPCSPPPASSPSSPTSCRSCRT